MGRNSFVSAMWLVVSTLSGYVTQQYTEFHIFLLRNVLSDQCSYGFSLTAEQGKINDISAWVQSFNEDIQMPRLY